MEPETRWSVGADAHALSFVGDLGTRRRLAALRERARGSKGVVVDGRQFDRMTRSLGQRADRRGMLQRLAAGLLAGLWVRQARYGTAAQDGGDPLPCTQDAECVDGDANSCTGGACVDGMCTFFIVDCIPGYACCGNGACCPTEGSADCLTDTDCLAQSDDLCEGLRCDGGTCTPFLAACTPDFACCGNGVCCPVANGCAEDTDCVGLGARSRCISGVCVPASTSV